MSVLPDGFAALEPFAGLWSAPDMAARAALRDAVGDAERQAFHAAMKSLVRPALERLDGKPLDALDPAERLLLALVLAYPHVAMAVEVQGGAEVRHAALRRHMRITPEISPPA
ncbi:hypothetical protein [Novosphingobium mangrovi (ex Huang et al. 2023)]|uniref:Uncharacterized protein n=1 Tax=Novosphingobium mangrovi (ex Huang et al. 2023) TaxID=2976432 RepID=A0ABT2I8N5_9SPHN|nr:hypothetical protein [Novosphingobium mangrovi (ex Huang et al. 2023)]MCT2401153.1 hypothetical protein [Novosphingobium mangrovi (ex Huang et al. 2023)]